MSFDIPIKRSSGSFSHPLKRRLYQNFTKNNGIHTKPTALCLMDFESRNCGFVPSIAVVRFI
jgi:hypothetical protein